MKALKLDFLKEYTDLGLLLMRAGLGASFVVHGWPKLDGGADKWAELGARMGVVTPIDVFPTFWGFMAAMAEFGGGILLVLGLLVRPVSFLLFFTMMVAMLWHIEQGDPFTTYSHAMELGIVFAGLFFVGGGKHSVDEHLK